MSGDSCVLKLCYYVQKRKLLNLLRRKCNYKYNWYHYDKRDSDLYHGLSESLKKQCSMLSLEIKKIRLSMGARLKWDASGNIDYIRLGDESMIQFIDRHNIAKMASDYEVGCILTGIDLPLAHIDIVINAYNVIIDNATKNNKKKVKS